MKNKTFQSLWGDEIVIEENKDKEVTFSYYHVKKDRETPIGFKNYSEALAFARYRANDKRYRNYEFFIY